MQPAQPRGGTLPAASVARALLSAIPRKRGRQMGTWRSVGWAWVLCAAACASGPRALPAEEDGPYLVGREDVLDVSVWRNADLSRVVPVRPDGFISLPMVGEVQAEGKSAAALAGEIAVKLAPFVQSPHVSVVLHEVNAARVYVTGEVIHPGAYPLRGRMSVVQALALAGGFTPFAQGDAVVVLRTRGGNARYELSYDELVGPGEEGKPAPEAWLRPGDTLVVP